MHPNPNPEPFAENDCTFDYKDHQFPAGGAFLQPCSDGRWRGVVYVREGPPNTGAAGHVTTWHGDVLAIAKLGRTYRGNFCKMRSIRFTWQGLRFMGRYCPDWSEAVRVR